MLKMSVQKHKADSEKKQKFYLHLKSSCILHIKIQIDTYIYEINVKKLL